MRSKEILPHIVGRHTKMDLAKIYRLQGETCYFCARRLNGRYQIDHLVPIAAGGTNWPINIALVCRPCNLAKGTCSESHFRKKCGHPMSLKERNRQNEEKLYLTNRLTKERSVMVEEFYRMLEKELGVGISMECVREYDKYNRLKQSGNGTIYIPIVYGKYSMIDHGSRIEVRFCKYTLTLYRATGGGLRRLASPENVIRLAKMLKEYVDLRKKIEDFIPSLSKSSKRLTYDKTTKIAKGKLYSQLQQVPHRNDHRIDHFSDESMDPEEDDGPN